MRSFLPFVFSLLLPALAAGQQISINEVMSSNHSVHADEFGEYSDWVELYNGGTNAVALDGWGLSDDAGEPFRWRFPDVRLESGAFLRVFASGRNVSSVVMHQETVVDLGDSWRYILGETEPPAEWKEQTFDAADWPEGPSGFGFGDDDDSTSVASDNPLEPRPVSIFVRTTFEVERLDEVLGMALHVDYDDGFVAYLNGTEIARANMGGEPPSHDRLADDDHEAALYRGGAPERFDVEQHSALLLEGTNTLAMQVHNAQEFSSDMSLIPFLTLQMSTAPAESRGLSPYIDLPLPNLHTAFAIDADGEAVYLSSPDGVVVDRVEVPALQSDLSWGRQPDGSGAWYYFYEPTPGAPNTTAAATGFAAPPEFVHAGGFYEGSAAVNLTAPAGAVIRYTLDGTEPTASSPRYDGPLDLTGTNVIRARTFAQGLLPSTVVTRTFFVDVPHPVPVLSLTTDPAGLFDRETGIYVRGPEAGGGFPYMGANFWKDWEREVHLEFFEPDGTLGFAGGAGIKIFGAWSRGYPQKSLSVFARGAYGMGVFEHPIFPELPLDKYEAFVLRNSGQDWTHTLFRDAFIQSLMDGTGLDRQAYRPALLYINGVFWGIHNLREKINEHFIAGHHDVEPDNIDLIERDEFVIHGDDRHYRRMSTFVRNHDPAREVNYDSLMKMIDVDNFIDYTSLFFYTMNYDWPWNNVKAWRPRRPDGRWRWISYDFDYSFNRIPRSAASRNIFEEIRSQNNVTVDLFYRLLRNDRSRSAFLNRFADHLNTRFSAPYVLAQIERFADRVRPLIPMHADRWRGSHSGPDWQGNAIGSLSEWKEHVQLLRDYAVRRAPVMRDHLVQEIGLPRGTGTVRLDAEPRDAGRIRINTIIPDDLPWSGVYFGDVPVTLTAVPNPGYRFSGWSMRGGLEGNPTQLAFEDGQLITARFEPVTARTSPAVINEINYNPPDHFDTEDWVELFNSTDAPLDLSGWTFKDGDDAHAFVLPEGTVLESGGYVVLVEDSARFGRLFADVVNYVGELGFGLSGDGELIRLYDEKGALVDSLTYGVTAPWPTKPDGTGATLALIDPFSENHLASSWTAAEPFGTPGVQNDAFPTAADPKEHPPPEYRLEGNYPNPFSAETRVAFSLPGRVDVSLRVYDLMGREVAVLVDSPLPPGRHEAVFDARDLASGAYFCRLDAGPVTRVHMMVRIK